MHACVCVCPVVVKGGQYLAQALQPMTNLQPKALPLMHKPLKMLALLLRALGRNSFPTPYPGLG